MPPSKRGMTAAEGWVREKVAFDAAYPGERVIAQLFLPKNATPPLSNRHLLSRLHGRAMTNKPLGSALGEFYWNVAFPGEERSSRHVSSLQGHIRASLLNRLVEILYGESRDTSMRNREYTDQMGEGLQTLHRLPLRPDPTSIRRNWPIGDSAGVVSCGDPVITAVEEEDQG